MNNSSAVRQQRREPPGGLDDFPTPPWAARALCEMLLARGIPLNLQTIWEPACNRGYLARGLADYVDPGAMTCTDIFNYGWSGQDGVLDFLDTSQLYGELPKADWIITNPPFHKAAEFIDLGLQRARVGVAMFVRNAFDESLGRYDALFRDRPEAFDFPFVERVIIHKGKLRQPGVKYWSPTDDGESGAMRLPSTATCYKWLVWLVEPVDIDTIKIRIPPCRERLEQPGDYPLPDLPPDDHLSLMRGAGL